jgi:hypothetical protein
VALAPPRGREDGAQLGPAGHGLQHLLRLAFGRDTHGPAGQAGGYLELIESLELRLARLTGYDAVSVQPNAGSQGELAGLLAIRGYHASRGEETGICLIPESATTNAARRRPG